MSLIEKIKEVKHDLYMRLIKGYHKHSYELVFEGGRNEKFGGYTDDVYQCTKCGMESHQKPKSIYGPDSVRLNQYDHPRTIARYGGSRVRIQTLCQIAKANLEEDNN